METGIHIGLAAWLHQRCDRAGFSAWPASPIAVELARLESATSATDMARIAEFSRMVNFVAEKGQAARPFDSTAPLWQVHRDVLAEMQFAARAWTTQENAQFEAARAVLYDTNGRTTLYQLYQEYKAAYQDMLLSATPSEISALAVEWELVGGKSTIEAALATIERLTAQSTLSRATAERDGLTFLPVDPAGAGYAMTGFSPISALDISGWVSAQVDLKDIDGVVQRATQSDFGPWTRWRHGKQGQLSFKFALLDIERDWFTPALYQGDDWRLPDNGIVADGNGNGRLPAYPARLYLVLSRLRSGL